MKKLLACALCICACFAAVPAAAQQTFHMADYWLTPHRTYTELFTRFRIDGKGDNCRDDGLGTHTFWHGSFMGQTETVALQGGIFDGSADHPGYDIFSLSADGEILYWGTFRGNKFNDNGANAFGKPVVWMNPDMEIGGSVSGMTEDHAMSNKLRTVISQGPWYYSLTVQAHFDKWANTFDPDKHVWDDVLRVTYTFGNSASPSDQFLEEYWLAKGIGTIAFKSHNPNEPSCVDFQYALWPPRRYDPGLPVVPWYDPFNWQTFVPNGFFEPDETAPEPPANEKLSSYGYSWTGWSGSPGFGNRDSEDVILINSPANAADTGSWKVALRVSPTEGWDMAISDPIPVLAKATYRLSGWLYRTSEADDVYLDMDDLTPDDNFYASAVGKWQYVQGDINVGPETSIQVRCVRDSGNTGDAFCDGITLQRLDLGGGGGSPPGPSTPPGTCPNGICERGEKYVRLLDDGTTVRETTCPQDCPSCGISGGDHCSQTGWCPEGYTSLGNTYDCTPCCESCESTGCPPESCGWQVDDCGEDVWCGDCLPSCGSKGGDYCSQSGRCPAGYTSLGGSYDCNPCCKSQPCQSKGCPRGSCGWQTDNCGTKIWCGNCQKSCGAKGGDYCSQSNSCPRGYQSLGSSYDCKTCCKKGPSCGQLGGNYCSQSGSCPSGGVSLGGTYDCNPCCQQ